MGYWLLQYNPAILGPNCPRPPEVPPKMDYWRISRYENRVRRGDTAFIWHAGPHRGIYNVAKIVSVEPHNAQAENLINLMWESDRPCYDPNEFNRLGQYRAILLENQYRDDLPSPLRVEELKREDFGNLPVIQMPRRGIYSLGQTMGERLLEYIQRTRGTG